MENCELNYQAYLKLEKSDQELLNGKEFVSGRRSGVPRLLYINPPALKCQQLGKKLKALDLASYLDPFALPEF